MMNNKNGLKPIAIYEASKGLLALLVGFGIHKMSTDNMQQVAEKLVSHLHLNPASHYPSIFINYVGNLGSTSLMLIAFAAVLYSIIRFVEAYGLWNGLRWTEWFALISGAVYLPFEAYEFITDTSFLSAAFVIVNSGIVFYVYYVLRQSKNTVDKISNND